MFLVVKRPQRWSSCVLRQNRLEALKGDRAGQYSIRVNDQWRICLRWIVSGSRLSAPRGLESSIRHLDALLIASRCENDPDTRRRCRRAPEGGGAPDRAAVQGNRRRTPAPIARPAPARERDRIVSSEGARPGWPCSRGLLR